MLWPWLMSTVFLLTPPLPPGASESPFGICNPWPEVGPQGMGASWCRGGGGSTALGDWPRTQPLPGVFCWEAADRELQMYEREGLVPCPILSYTPAWASRAPGIPEADKRPPLRLWDYFHFCQETAARYAGRVHFWEIWNEPNIGFFQGTTADYTDLLKTGALGVGAGNSQAFIIFGGMAGVDQPFLELCYQHGVADYFDIMAAHPYQWGRVLDDGWLFHKLDTLRAVMQAWKDASKPIWINEIGWSQSESRLTEQDQARLLVQSYVSAIARRDLGVERVFWYCVKDWGKPDYGVYADDGRKKLAWHAYQTMARSLQGRKCIGQLPVDPAVRAYVFAGQNAEAVIVLWSADLQVRSVSLPLKSAPARVWDMCGAPLPSPPAAQGEIRLPVPPEPIYVQASRPDGREMTEIKPLQIMLPAPQRRPRGWLNIYPQPGCEQPWLWRGRAVTLQGRLFNASPQRVQGEIRLAIVDNKPQRCGTPAKTSVAVGPWADAQFRLSVFCPPEAPEEVTLLATAHLDKLRLPPLQVRALVGAGPTINFFANSFLEHQLYLQPEAQSGCAESVRFGTRWIYRLPVPFLGHARVQMDVGAHKAGPWSVAWSADGRQWQKLMAGRSERQWQAATIEHVPAEYLYLKCEGEDQQVRAVRVTFIPVSPGNERVHKRRE